MYQNLLTSVKDLFFLNVYARHQTLRPLVYILKTLWLSSAGPISILPLWLTTDIVTMNPGQVILIGSTICVMLTTHFAAQLISEHLFHWKKPKEQKAIVIITLMAPIYAIDSFVGLLDFQGSKAFFMFLDSVKECYEALVRFYYMKGNEIFFFFLFCLVVKICWHW